MPPPSGTTEAEDALKPVSGESSVEGKGDGVPATAEHEGKTTEKAKGSEDGKSEETATGKAGEEAIPTAKQAEESANTAIAEDESEEEVLLEGQGQADADVPSARAADESANKAILVDESKDLDTFPGTEHDSLPARQMEGMKLGETAGGKKPETETEGGGGLAAAITATTTDEAQRLPGTKTQDQPAARGEEAEESVAD